MLFKTNNPRIIATSYGALNQLTDCYEGHLDEICFLEIVQGTTLDLVLAYSSFRPSLEVHSEQMCPEIVVQFVIYDWNSGDAFGLAN